MINYTDVLLNDIAETPYILYKIARHTFYILWSEDHKTYV